MATEISKRLFNVDEYYRMADAGILSPQERVELIRGEVVTMCPPGPPHGGSVLRATNTLVPLVKGRALVNPQNPIRLDRWSEPQPDIALLRPRSDFYTTRHPTPQDVFLVIEIADSSLGYDLKLKAGLYAETGIVEYWVADISNDCVWVHSDLQDNAYRSIRQFHRGESIAPRLLADCPIPVDALLP